MHKITLHNSVHGTQVTTWVPSYIESEREAWQWIQQASQECSGPDEAPRRREQRVRKALCGHTGCKCGVVRPN